jgi:ATP-dependent Clp protease ATP-binding subunit ClpA
MRGIKVMIQNEENTLKINLARHSKAALLGQETDFKGNKKEGILEKAFNGKTKFIEFNELEKADYDTHNLIEKLMTTKVLELPDKRELDFTDTVFSIRHIPQQ